MIHRARDEPVNVRKQRLQDLHHWERVSSSAWRADLAMLQDGTDGFYIAGDSGVAE